MAFIRKIKPQSAKSVNLFKRAGEIWAQMEALEEVWDGTETNLLRQDIRPFKKPLQWAVDNGIWTAQDLTDFNALLTKLYVGLKSKWPTKRPDGVEVLEDLS